MDKQLEKSLKTFLKKNVKDFIDYQTGEVDITALSEEACNFFDIPTKLEEQVYEMSSDLVGNDLIYKGN